LVAVGDASYRLHKRVFSKMRRGAIGEEDTSRGICPFSRKRYGMYGRLNCGRGWGQGGVPDGMS
jgi:hypothetical protein